MTTSSKAEPARAKPAKKATVGARAVKSKPKSKSESAANTRSDTNAAIATELAPAVAIALLDKTEQSPGDPAPALECLAVAAAPSESLGKVRLQLLFENGAVLPVEMTTEAGLALSKGLSAELPKK